jgi:GNAT superfamily N-acetyltransferase
MTDKEVEDRRELIRNLMDGLEGEFPGVHLSLSYDKFNDMVVLSKIVVDKQFRSKGIGSVVMGRITDFADRYGMKVGLTPSGDFGGSVKRLKGFYGGFGFKNYKGYEHRETMQREPSVKLSEILFEGYLYHVTPKRNLKSIVQNGLRVRTPRDMEDEPGVYLFKDLSDAEDAVTNWMGDRFDEDEELVVIKVDDRFVGKVSSNAAGFEVVSTKDIPPEGIVGYEVI